MDLCSNGHEEVCFESNYCPACYVISEKVVEIKDQEADNDTLSRKIDELEEKIKDLESQKGGE